MTDIAVLYEVFVKKEYEIDFSGEPEVIFDFGSNIGATIAYFLLSYPRANIYSVEANKNMFDRLKLLFATDPRVTLFYGAISDKSGTVDFFIHKSDLSSSLYDRKGSTEKVSVPAFTVDDIFSTSGENHADIIKFDIEGGEYALFSGNPDFLSRTRALVGEVHPDIVGRDGKAIVDALSNFSVEKVQLQGKRFLVKAIKK